MPPVITSKSRRKGTPRRRAAAAPVATPAAAAASASTSVRAAARQTASVVYRDHILAAAEAEFTGTGYAATRMADIARRAGMSVGALYRHFDSKEAIFADLVARSGEGFIDLVERTGAAALAPAARIEALVHASLAFIEDNRAMFQVFTQVRDSGIAACEAISGPVGDLQARTAAVYRRALEEGVAARVLRDDVAIDDQLNFYRGAMHGFIEDWILRGAVGGLAAKAPLIARLFLRALGGPS